MSNGINRVFFGGNVCSEPDLREGKGGSVLVLRIASNGGYKDSTGKWIDTVEYATAKLFGERAGKVADLIAKGQTVTCEGRLVTEEWTDKEGQKRRDTSIKVDNLIIGATPKRGDDDRRARDDRDERPARRASRDDDDFTRPRGGRGIDERPF